MYSVVYYYKFIVKNVQCIVFIIVSSVCCIQGQKDKWTKRQKDKRTNRQKVQMAKGQKDKRTKGLKDKRTKGQQDKRTTGRKDKRTKLFFKRKSLKCSVAS